MRKVLLYVTGICCTVLLCGQEVEVTSSTEEMDTAKFAGLIRSYEKLIMAEREELTLIKIDLLGPLLYTLSGIDTAKHNLIRVALEQKFKPEWSWILAADGQASKNAFTEWRFRGGARYYFNMQKRILNGKSANNFSANYISTRVNYKYRPPDKDHQVSLDLLFGIQRRIWKIGYVDFDIGFENIFEAFDDRITGVDLTSSIQLGIAF